jgi:hypothetical protein
VSSQAISEAAQRFVSGDVRNQSLTFPPSVAEFCTEARRIAELIPYRNRQSLPAPAARTGVQGDRAARIRMRLKIPLWQRCLSVPDGADRLAAANAAGLEELIALAQEWDVPVPEELWSQVRTAA